MTNKQAKEGGRVFAKKQIYGRRRKSDGRFGLPEYIVLTPDGSVSKYETLDQLRQRKPVATTSTPMKPHTGADLVALWEQGDVIGSRPDIADAQQYARTLREEAQTRNHDATGEGAGE